METDRQYDGGNQRGETKASGFITLIAPAVIQLLFLVGLAGCFVLGVIIIKEEDEF